MTPNSKKGVATIVSVILGFVVSAIVIMIMGYNPIELIAQLFQGSFSTTDGMWRTMQTWGVFILLALAVAIGFKAGLFNIGVAGQMMFGAMMGYLFVYAHQDIKPGLLLFIAFVIGFVSALAFGLLAGFLKAFFGVNEVVTTIMLNWIAVKISKGLKDSKLIPSGSNDAILPLPKGVDTTMSSISPYFTYGLFIAIALVVITFILFRYTKLGMKIKVSGSNIDSAKYAGYKSKGIMIIVLGLSAAIAGLAGFFYYYGTKGVMEYIPNSHFNEPPVIGFTGITITLVALNNPIAILPSALLFAAIQGDAALLGLDSTTPQQIGQLFSSIVVYFVAVTNIFIYFINPKEFKKWWSSLKEFYKNKQLSVWTKTWVTSLNIVTIGWYSHVINHNNWGKFISYKNRETREVKHV